MQTSASAIFGRVIVRTNCCFSHMRYAAPIQFTRQTGVEKIQVKEHVYTLRYIAPGKLDQEVLCVDGKFENAIDELILRIGTNPAFEVTPRESCHSRGIKVTLAHQFVGSISEYMPFSRSENVTKAEDAREALRSKYAGPPAGLIAPATTTIIAVERKLPWKAQGEIHWRDDTGKRHWAEFGANSDPWGLRHNLPAEIHFNATNARRSARVMKTVIYLAVDEEPTGRPRLEKWKCRTVQYKLK